MDRPSETSAADESNDGLVLLNFRRGENPGPPACPGTLIIAGVTRGSTTILARVLTRLGAFFGNLTDPGGEDADIRNALESGDSKALQAIISDRNRQFDTWGFKIPGRCNSLFASDVRCFRNPRFIAVFCDPVVIGRRNSFSEGRDASESILRAAEDAATLARYISEMANLGWPILNLSYHKALSDAARLVEELITFCGLAPSDEQKLAALGAIRAGGSVSAHASPSHVEFIGTIDNIERNVLRGWCRFLHSEQPVDVEVFADAERLGSFPANDYREDLRNASIGAGFHAFNVDLTPFDLRATTNIWVRPLGVTEFLPKSNKSVTFLSDLGVAARPLKIKILTMLKDEDDLASSWIRYHASLVGYENLIILDNGSASRRTLAALESAAQSGANVSYQFSTQEEFVRRGSIYVELIQGMDAADPADFYLPIDCDEFLAVERAGRVDCSRTTLEEELLPYLDSHHPLKIYGALDNHPHKAGLFRWSLGQRKTFFARGACGVLDHGFHVGQSRFGLAPIRTKLVYIHYHYKPYALLIAHSKLKLAPFTTDFSAENMRAYVEQKRDAWHCAAHVLCSEQEYLSGFNDPAFIEFPEIRDAFDSLGMRLPFSGE